MKRISNISNGVSTWFLGYVENKYSTSQYIPRCLGEVFEHPSIRIAHARPPRKARRLYGYSSFLPSFLCVVSTRSCSYEENSFQWCNYVIVLLLMVDHTWWDGMGWSETNQEHGRKRKNSSPKVLSSSHLELDIRHFTLNTQHLEISCAEALLLQVQNANFCTVEPPL